MDVTIIAVFTVALCVAAVQTTKRWPKSILGPLLVLAAGATLLFEVAFSIAQIVGWAAS